MSLYLRGVLLVGLALFLGGCCEEPVPLNLHELYLPDDLLAELDEVRATIGAPSVAWVVRRTTDLYITELMHEHGLQHDDDAKPGDGGAWRIVLRDFAVQEQVGQRDKYCARSKIRPPCDPGLVCVPTRPDRTDVGICRAAPDAGQP